jgi:NADH dehydrogenase
VQRCLDAVTGSTARLVFLSYVGADPAVDNPYLQTKGLAEQLTGDAGDASVVLRSTLIYGDADDIDPSFATCRTRPGGTVWVLGDGQQRVAPIHVDDLADLIIAAALDPAAPTGTFAVRGPTVYRPDGFVRRINPPGVTTRHLPATLARLVAHVVPQLTPALVDVLTGDSVTANDPDEIAGRFGVMLHDAAAAAAQETTR